MHCLEYNPKSWMASLFAFCIFMSHFADLFTYDAFGEFVPIFFIPVFCASVLFCFKSTLARRHNLTSSGDFLVFIFDLNRSVRLSFSFPVLSLSFVSFCFVHHAFPLHDFGPCFRYLHSNEF